MQFACLPALFLSHLLYRILLLTPPFPLPPPPAAPPFPSSFTPSRCFILILLLSPAGLPHFLLIIEVLTSLHSPHSFSSFPALSSSLSPSWYYTLILPPPPPPLFLQTFPPFLLPSLCSTPILHTARYSLKELPHYTLPPLSSCKFPPIPPSGYSFTPPPPLCITPPIKLPFTPLHHFF